MSDLYNTLTRKPETLPEDKIQHAILQGTHSYPADAQINVIKPSGDSVAVSGVDLPEALKNGYRMETAREGAVKDYVAENEGIAGAAKVALGKFADEAGMGIPGLIYDKTGDQLEVAKWDALKKEHAAATAVGSATGFGASMLVGGPLFKAAGTAGEAVTKVVASKLAAAGIERGSTSMAKDIVARMATGAVKLGTEGAVISMPRAITEAALGDPEQAAETVLAGAGIGMGLGMTGGLLAKPFNALREKAGQVWDRAKNKFVEAATEETGSHLAAAHEIPMSHVDPETATLSDVVGASNATPEFQKTFAQQVAAKRPDADEVSAAFKAIGGEASEGALSNKKIVREAESTVINDPTLVVGQGLRDLQERNYEAVVSAATKAAGPGESMALSKFQTGQAVQESLADKIEGRGSDFNEKYGAIENTFERVPVSEKAKSQIARNILKMDEVASAPNSPTAVYLKNVARDLEEGKLENLKQLKIFKSAYGKTVNPELKFAAGVASEKLAALEEASIERHAGTMRTPKAKQTVMDYLEARRATNADYGQFKDELSELGKALGRKRIRGAGDFAELVRDMPAEQLTDRLFSLKNPKFLGFMSQKYPQEFEALVALKKNQIIEAATHDGHVSPAKVFTAVGKFSPEVQAHILGENAPLFKAAKTAFEAMPSQLNPSGTARMQAYREALSLGGAVKNASAYAKTMALKSPHALIYIEKTMKHAAQKLDFIPQAIDKMSKATGDRNYLASVGAISRLVGGAGGKKTDFEHLSENIASTAANPSMMAEKLSHAAAPLHDTAPGVASQYSQKMMQAIKYLDSQLPKPISPPNPMIKQKYKPSDADLSAFERKLHTVMDPYSIIDDLKNGTITHDQVHALRAVYPKIYEQIQHRIVQHISESETTVPYQARLKISLLMGAPMDDSLSPQAIQSYQASFIKEEDAQKATPQPKAEKLNIANRTDPKSRFGARA